VEHPEVWGRFCQNRKYTLDLNFLPVQNDLAYSAAASRDKGGGEMFYNIARRCLADWVIASAKNSL